MLEFDTCVLTKLCLEKDIVECLNNSIWVHVLINFLGWDLGNCVDDFVSIFSISWLSLGAVLVYRRKWYYTRKRNLVGVGVIHTDLIEWCCVTLVNKKNSFYLSKNGGMQLGFSCSSAASLTQSWKTWNFLSNKWLLVWYFTNSLSCNSFFWKCSSIPSYKNHWCFIQYSNFSSLEFCNYIFLSSTSYLKVRLDVWLSWMSPLLFWIPRDLRTVSRICFDLLSVFSWKLHLKIRCVCLFTLFVILEILK